LNVGGENRFSAVVPEIDTHLRFGDARGPFASEAYVVEGLDEPVKGTTDGDGKLTITAPVTVKVAKIRFEKRGLTFSALLGEMDPVTEASGVQLRLALLGYLKGPASGELDDATVEALKAFQKAKELPQNGAMDPPTLDALQDAYGC
jgi:peptidoglycan hydrolase-like protein with peptidoglycan-binding domain